MVVLPPPEAPTSATVWPGNTSNETPRSTGCPGDSASTAAGSSDGSDTFASG